VCRQEPTKNRITFCTQKLCGTSSNEVGYLSQYKSKQLKLCNNSGCHNYTQDNRYCGYTFKADKPPEDENVYQDNLIVCNETKHASTCSENNTSQFCINAEDANNTDSSQQTLRALLDLADHQMAVLGFCFLLSTCLFVTVIVYIVVSFNKIRHLNQELEKQLKDKEQRDPSTTGAYPTKSYKYWFTNI
jgi:hypothetical protein